MSVEEEEWYEDRGGHFFCKRDGVPLERLYVVTGTFEPPTFQCPKCKLKMKAG